MKKARHLRITLLLVAFVFAATGGGSAQDDPELADRLFTLANKIRGKSGLPLLTQDARLRASAKMHAERLAAKDTVTAQLPGEPDVPERIKKANVEFSVAGEVQLALPDIGSSVDEEEQRASEALLTNETLRTILSPKFTAADFAVVRTGTNIYAVGDFVWLLHPMSAEEAARVFVAKVQEVRRKQGMEEFTVRAAGKLNKAACEMAQKDVTAPPAKAVPDKKNLVNAYLFSISDPGKVSGISEMAELIHEKEARVMAVGSCVASSKTSADGKYWFLVALYR